MYKLCRVVLILAVAAAIACLLLLVMRFGPWAAVVIFALFCIANARKGYASLTECGSASWATAHQLRQAGLLGGGTGLYVGLFTDDGRPTKRAALLALFNPRVGSADACRGFIDALFGGAR